IALVKEQMIKEANPRLLNEYRLLLKKEISFFRRSWTAAYLLMLYDQGQNRQNPRGNDAGREENPRGFYRDSRGDRRNQGGLAEAAACGAIPAGRFVLAEEESKRLFISIGRNRRLFPREILSLIINAAQVEREDIGSIRILDSYSFVQVRDTVADRVIEALNGAMFRGRTLTVNYAYAKREGDGGNEAESAEIAETAEAPLDLSIKQGDDPPHEEGI
ncbi:MAG: DbpA RNA binding domain-containing protein, partial [Treponema sp.]|nr:DbpA RNA binding domain-containing protein [Treponema sp.]